MRLVTVLLAVIIPVIVSGLGCGGSFLIVKNKRAASERVYPGPCTITDVEKNTTRTFEYNAQNQVSKITGKGFTSEFDYDSNGNISKKKIRNQMVDASFFYTWDEFNNLLNVKFVPANNSKKTLQYAVELTYSGNAGASNVVSSYNYGKDGFPNAHFFETRFNIALLSSGEDISVEKKINYNSQKKPVSIEVTGIDVNTVNEKNCEPTVTNIEYNALGLVKEIQQTNGIFPEHPDIKVFQYDDLKRPILIVDSTYGNGKYFQKKIEHVYDTAGNTISIREFEEGNTIRLEKYDYSCWPQ